MKEICLVYEQGGDYDTYYTSVILVYETLAEGERAVELIKEELKALPDFPYHPDPADRRADETHDEFSRRKSKEKDDIVRGICKVYPVVRPDGNGGEFVSVPDKDTIEAEFTAVMVPINKLP